MFTTSHFLWMGITVLVILITSFLLARFRCPTRPLLTGCLVLCVISELIKTFSNTVETGLFTNVSGPVKFLPVSCLPLQLCSLQIFFLFYQYFSKNEQRKADLNGFMCMCMAVGAPFAILLPNSSVSFSSPVAYQFFLFHAMLIVYAIHQIRTGSVTYSLRNLKIDLVLLLVLGIVSIWINSIFTAMGAPTDFLYTMCPPADNLPYLNLNQGWEMYVVKLTVLAMVLMLLITWGIALGYRYLHNRLIRSAARKLQACWADTIDPVEVKIEVFGLGNYLGHFARASDVYIPLDILTLLSVRYDIPLKTLVEVFVAGVMNEYENLLRVRKPASRVRPAGRASDEQEDICISNS